MRSQRRASDVRAARPALARQSRVWIAAGFAGWIVPSLLGVEPFRRRLRSGVAWWASSAVMFDWHLGMVEEEDGRPVLLGAPDACTLLRVWLVPVAADAAHPGAVGVAAATDVLDGRLARASRIPAPAATSRAWPIRASPRLRLWAPVGHAGCRGAR